MLLYSFFLNVFEFWFEYVIGRETVNSKEFKHKQELIDAAEVSGLSRAPIVYVVVIIIMHLDMLIIFLNLFLKLIDDSVSGLCLLS